MHALRALGSLYLVSIVYKICYCIVSEWSIVNFCLRTLNMHVTIPWISEHYKVRGATAHRFHKCSDNAVD